MKKVLLFVLTLFVFVHVNAEECLEKEYIDWASDLKPVFTVFNYNEHEDLDLTKYQYAYFLSLSKERDDITFNVIDKYNNTIPADHFDEINIYGAGLYKEIEGKEETYKIEVYGNAKGSCNGKLITTLEYTVPAFNQYYKTQYCDKYKEHELCQVFTNATQNMTLDDFKSEMRAYEEELNKKNNFFARVWDFIVSIRVYILCVLIPIIAVSIYYNLKIKRYKKMRNRKETVRRHNKNYVILFLMLFLLVGKVNASGVCGDATIIEGPITSAGWATRLILCDFYDTGRKTSIGGTSDFASAVAAGEELVEQTVWAADGKSSSSIFVPMCRIKANGGPGQVDAEITSTYTYLKWECDACCDGVDENGKPCTPSGHDQLYEDDCKDTKEDVSGDITPPACGDCAANVPRRQSCETEVKYYVRCPIYACNPVEQTVEGWCNATFKVNGDDAYCVNPSDKFPNGIPNNYQTQPFDPTTCKSSNSTPDCGFANILIEAEYYSNRHPENKISYETRNMALRLWAADLELGGFYRVGLAYMRGYDCGEYVAYPAENHVNVYVESLNYIWRLYFEALKREGVDHSVEGLLSTNFFKNIACTPGQLGVVCQGLTNSYVQAFALFFNTYFGNEDMQNHLANLYGGRETEPISATVSSQVIDEYSVVEVKYREEITIGEKIECSDIKAKKASGQKLTENEEKVLFYCNNEITHVIGLKPDGTLIDLATKTIVTDLNGDGRIDSKDFLLLPEGETFDFSYCQKNMCYSPTVYFALCDEVKKEEEKFETIYTTIRYTESGSRYSIKKYLACGSGDYQMMYSYDEGEQPGRTWDVTIPTTKPPVKTLTLDFYCYDEGGCDNYNIRIEDKNSCAKKSSGHGEVKIKDPSLSCIINMQSSVAKKAYDYSEFFGVNSDFCKIYCSDTAEYYMANKVDIYSGLSFKLDIEYDVFKSNKSNKPFTNVVIMKRDCVSNIFYNNEFDENIDWSQIYAGLEGKTIKNWKQLYSALRKYGKAEGHINQILYDLYNCNLYKNIPVYRPKDNEIGNVYERILDIFSAENSYGFNGDKYGYNFGTQLNAEKNDVVTSEVKYDGGAYYIGSKSRVGKDYSNIILKHQLNNHTGYTAGKAKNVSDIRYCSGKECFAYDKKKDEYLLPHDLGLNTSNKTSGNIPTNDYAYFTVSNEIDFYNDSLFQVEPYTGNVEDITNKASNADYLQLDKYVYPVGVDAYAVCKNNNCNLTHRISINQTYYRKMGSGTNAFKEAIKQSVHACPHTLILPPVEIQTEAHYRNVDLSNMFPTTLNDGSRRIGVNWENSTAYINETEQYYNGQGALKYYETHLEYSYTLSQDAIKKIKEYNATNGGVKTYTDNTIEKGSCSVGDRIKTNCRSSFISSINNNTNPYGIVNNRQSSQRGVSDYTIEKKNGTLGQ